jgi:hypothetical protein
MPLLNFKERFVVPILSGRKKSTIRAYRKDKKDPKPGQPLYLYTGVRTKKVKFLRLEKCVSVIPIEIAENGEVTDVETGFLIIGKELLKLVMREGFESSIELIQFFRKEHGLPFAGLWINWE